MVEKSTENKLKNYFNNNANYNLKIHGNKFQRRGIPDLLICFRSRFLAIEVKQGYNKPSIFQKSNLQEIRGSGGLGFIINEKNLKEFLTILDSKDWDAIIAYSEENLKKFQII